MCKWCDIRWDFLKYRRWSNCDRDWIYGRGWHSVSGWASARSRVAQVTELTAQWPMSRSPSHTNPSQATHGRRSRSECCTAHRISRQVTGQPRVCNGNMASKTSSCRPRWQMWLTTPQKHKNHNRQGRTTCQLFADFCNDCDYLTILHDWYIIPIVCICNSWITYIDDNGFKWRFHRHCCRVLQ